MNAPNLESVAVADSSRQGHRLLQVGSALFLFGLLTGLVVERFAVPRLGLSVHLLGLTQGPFLMIIGLLWPKLRLARSWLRIAFSLVIYGCFAALAANLLGAIFGAGNSLLPLAAGSARGSFAEEMIIAIGLRTGGAALIISVGLVIWGLRRPEDK